MFGGKGPWKNMYGYGEEGKETPFGKMTKKTGMPKVNVDNVKFDDWDWEKNDPDFYRQY